MNISIIDWAIIGTYCAFMLGLGIYYSKRASKNVQSYFLSGRTLPWWIIGTSMVATTFSADTPLAVTEYVHNGGIWRNWFWWNTALGGLLSVFLFAHLWRRAKVITDNELIEIRYAGKSAAGLRAFKAVYFSTIYNFVVMAWVIQAMSTILGELLGIPKDQQWLSIGICVTIALGYTVLSGFWGVVMTDIYQFAMGMVGAIALAIICLGKVGGIGELKSKLAALPSSHESTLSFIPPLDGTPSPLHAEFWTSPTFTLIIFLGLMWWSAHNADGGGYIIQRMSAAKDERHATIATLWFNIAQYALRVWPWIIVALVTMVAFPELSGDRAKEAYPRAISTFMPVGLKGITIASFLGAFMSTIDTHLNWGTSYLINDVYKRFLVREATPRHYVLISRCCCIVLMLIAAVVAMHIDSISKAWEFLLPMGAGVGLVLILRWFWWRINAWSEIAGLSSSVIINLIIQPFGLQVQHRIAIIVPSSIAIWVTVTFLTKPVPKERLVEFYKRVRPGGFWGPIREEIKDVGKGSIGWHTLVNWIAGVFLIYGTTFGIGKMIFQDFVTGGVLLGLAAVGAVVIYFNFPKHD
jgi:Na+/proline symporter